MATIRPNPQMNKLTKDSGVLLEGFHEAVIEAKDYDELITAYLEAMDGKGYLGITRGGNQVTFEQASRTVEYDGRRVRSVGDFTVDSSTPQITTTLLIHHGDNLARIFPMSDVTVDSKTGMFSMRPRLGTPQAGDYMKDLSLVREMADGTIRIETIFNAINTASPTFTGADMSESECACTFVGNAASWDDTAHAPIEIIMFPPEEPEEE